MRLVQVIVSTVATGQLSPALTTAEAEEETRHQAVVTQECGSRGSAATSTTGLGHTALWDLKQRFGELLQCPSKNKAVPLRDLTIEFQKPVRRPPANLSILRATTHCPLLMGPPQ